MRLVRGAGDRARRVEPDGELCQPSGAGTSIMLRRRSWKASRGTRD